MAVPHRRTPVQTGVPMRVAAAVMATIAVAIVACTAEDRLDPDQAVPSPRPGAGTPVDVCRLVPITELSAIAGHDLSVVDARFLAATLPTYQCGFGVTVGRPLVTLSLAPGPVAIAVFDEAYGEPAGGDPALVRRLGDRAYQREESATRSIVVLSTGAIVRVTAPHSRAAAIRPRLLPALARAAVGRLPRNPELGVPGTGPPCSEVAESAVADAIGAPVELATQVAWPDGSAVCSWAGLPGAATVTVLDGRTTYERIRNEVVERDGMVHGVHGARAWSAANTPGDLTALVAPDRVLRVEVVPAAGWADDDVPTGDTEVALANAVIAALA